jgi:hypothetical protein
MGQDSAFVSFKRVSGVAREEVGNEQMDSSPHTAKISVGVMLRAAKTAVQALMAEISPWILLRKSAWLSKT